MALPRRLRVEPLEDRRLLAITVNTLVDELDGSIADGDISLRDAIAAAPAGETIDFSVTGTINLTLGELKISKALTIAGPGAGLLTVDASGNDPTPDENNGDGSRVFNIDDGTSATPRVSLLSVILTGGDVTGDGGAIRNHELLSLINVTVHNNAATNYGGGIFSDESLTLTGSSVFANTTPNRGGGIATLGGGLTMTDGSVHGNSALGGGGLHVQSTFGQIRNSTVTGNTATTGGGGIRQYRGQLTVFNSIIDENSGGYGGGIRNNQGLLIITDSSVSRNVGTFTSGTERGGGGVFNITGDLTITNSTISGNTSHTRGGGIFASVGNLKITSSFVEDNNSSLHGGGIYGTQTTLKIDGTSISRNTSQQGGGGIYRPRFTSSDQAPLEIKNSLISGNRAEQSGGGVFGALQEITNSSVVGNTASGNGGGLYGGPISVTDSIVDGNGTAGVGGGIWSRQLMLTRSTVSRNVALLGGGGVFSPEVTNFSLTTVTISECIFSENVGYLRGGAIHMQDGTLTITNSAFQGNVAIGTGEFSGHGGGIYGGGEWTIAGSQFVGNKADNSGGGISANSGTLTINGCLFTANTSGFSGGGLSVFTHDTEILNSTFNRNTAKSDGGGASLRSTVIMGGCAFEDNIAGSRGGGIFVESEISIDNSAMSGNQAGTDGGGIHFRYGSLSLENATITGNIAAGRGGGIYTNVYDGNQVTLLSTTVGENHADGNGGGVYIWSRDSNPSLSILHSTITRNTTDKAGGGLFLSTGTLALSHTIVAQNEARLGTDLTGVIGAVFDPRHSLIGNNSASGLATSPEGTADVKGNLIGSAANVLDPLLDAGAEIGGAGLTYALLPGSPAINAGNATLVAGSGGTPLFDGRGGPFSRLAGGRIDIGAHERQTLGPLTLVVDTLDDVSNGNVGAGNLSLREAIGIANGNPGTLDTINFSQALATDMAVISLVRGELGITDSLTINGLGPTRLTIDASAGDPTPELNNGDGHRIFNIGDKSYTTNVAVEISGLTLTGGDTNEDGGAIRSAETLSLLHSTITGNAAQQAGGGLSIYGYRQSLNVIGCTFTQNVASLGGGLHAVASTSDITIKGSTFYDNHAIRLNETYTVHRGGGINLHAAATGPAHFLIQSSTISGNTATEGGGIYSGFDGLTVSFSTVTNNFARGYGGGIATQSGFVEFALNHSIVAGNSSNLASTPDLRARVLVFHSLIGDQTGAQITRSVGSFLGTQQAPINPRLTPLADNGGPTLTHSLLSGSLALNGGDPTAVPGGYTGSYYGSFEVPHVDQRGPGFSRVISGRIDIGAVELQDVPTAGDFDGDGDVDGRDFLSWQRSPSVGSLSVWQAEYGAGGEIADLGLRIAELEEEELGSRPRLREGKALRWNDEEERAGQSPASVSVAALTGLGTSRLAAALTGLPPQRVNSTSRLAALEPAKPQAAEDERFIEEVDRVMETISMPITPLCRNWGEMVVRRNFAKPQVASKD